MNFIRAEEDHFLRHFNHALSSVLEPQQARLAVGPHVYFFICKHPTRYPSGLSHVQYIGYTDSPASRFPGHEHLQREDRVMLLELTPILRKLKDKIPEWRTLGGEIREISMEMEFVFIYMFRDLCGDKPTRNVQIPEPAHKTKILAEFVLHSQERLVDLERLRDALVQLGQQAQQLTAAGINEVPVVQSSVVALPESGNTTSQKDKRFEGLTCEEAIMLWFRLFTKKKEKVNITEMYDYLTELDYHRATVRTTRARLCSEGKLCDNGSEMNPKYRLNERYR